VIAYELLSGRLPFLRSAHMDMLLAHATERPPTFAELELRSWVPTTVEAVVFACLEKDPRQRPQSARELADEFAAALTAPEITNAEPELALPALPPVDPDAMIYEIDAWMPRQIALMKLRGFVHDTGGEILDSEPGKILLRLGQTAEHQPAGRLSWFRAPRLSANSCPAMDVEMRLEQLQAQRHNHLHVTLTFLPVDKDSVNDPHWRDRCHRLFCEIRAYLMGYSEVV
jgi:serine/threonine-protein kinase